jgi:hypothetical protein
MCNDPERSFSVAGEDGLVHAVTYYGDLRTAVHKREETLLGLCNGGTRHAFTSCQNIGRYREGPMALRDIDASRDLRRVNCIACLSAK